jgi:8-oxo-dGTP diphosphatase
MTDWPSWTPKERATLCFIVSGGRVLLIRKKRGLGAGKINAPGGKIEPDELPVDCAVRETREEVLVEAQNAVEHGELFFQFTDGYSLHCHVFRADGCLGEPGETDEALPIWTPLDAIPYHDMWPDDAQWLPLLLAGKHFRGWFEFDGERMLDCRVDLVSADFFQSRTFALCPAS